MELPPRYLERLWAALAGGDLPRDPEPVVMPVMRPIQEEIPTSDPAREAARLRAVLEDREQRIAVMKQEYAQLEEARDRAVALAGQEQLARLFNTLAGSLSNLAVLSDLAQAGQTVSEHDMRALVRSLFRDLETAGLQTIGRVGETVAFDAARHQRISGGAGQAGSPVVIEVPGFCLREKMVLKAMVSHTGREAWPKSR